VLEISVWNAAVSRFKLTAAINGETDPATAVADMKAELDALE
jgi:hypothetical protein